MSLRTTPPSRRAAHAAAAIAFVTLLASCGGNDKREPTAPLARDPVLASVEGEEAPPPRGEGMVIPDVSEDHSSHIVTSALAAALDNTAIVGMAHAGGHFQASIVSAAHDGFPTQGSTFLVVTSGDSRNYRTVSSSFNSGCLSDAMWGTLCNVGGIDIQVAVPAGVSELSFDVGYFDWDYPPYQDPFRVYVVPPGGSQTLIATYTQTSEFGPGKPGGFDVGPLRTVTVDVVAYRGQTITVRLRAADRYDTVNNAGALIDNFEFDGGVPPNSAPVVSITGEPYATNEGTGIILTATASDADGDALTYDWNFGDGSAHGTTLNAPHTYDDDGSYTATLTVNDGNGGVTSASTVVSVSNVAPTATLSAPATVNEGGSFVIELTGTFDPSSADVAAGFTFTLDCGDGNTSTNTDGTPLTCMAPDNAVRTVAGTITDKDGGTSSYTASVTINNVSPTVHAGAGATILSGQSFTLNGSFSDPGLFDYPWSYTINWSDGTPTVAATSSQGAISGSHTYLRAGTYTVTLSVTDKDLGTAADATSVVVQRIPVGGPAGYEVINVEGVGHGMVTIDVLSAGDVDATTIVASSATLGNESGDETAVEKRNNGTYMTTVQDIDGDGRMDMSLKFRRDKLRATGDLTDGTEHLILLADLADGRQVRGVYNVRTVPK